MTELQKRAQALSALAHAKLVRRLEGAGNAVSPAHREATRIMLAGMVRQALGVEPGRFAYDLPCGGGKTQGVAALTLAASEIEPGLTFAVATSQVEALCQMKRQLIDAGMSPDDIGLWHSLKVDKRQAGSGTGYASEPSTGENGTPRVLLLSHEKVRRLRERMIPRSLLVWDESLIATEAQSVSVASLNTANVMASTYAPKMTPHLAKVVIVIGNELAALQADRERKPRTLDGILTYDEMQALRDALSGVNRRDPFGRALSLTVDALLKLLALPVSVVANGSGAAYDGVIRYEVTVDPALSNIAILDASHTIRLLTQADNSMRTVKLPDYKSYSAVTVRQIAMATGRQTMLRNEVASKSVARQIVKVIEGLPEGEPILVFTFKDALDYLRRNVAAEGLDTSRLEFATWGQETSRNEWMHCKHIIMAGVLRRNPLDLSSSLIGQQQDTTQRNSAKALRDVTLSEMAHCVLQGMNRGACRLTDANGEAHRMTCTILASKASELRDILADSLPGVVWTDAEQPRATPTKASQAAESIEHYLASLTVARVSRTAINKALPEIAKLNARTIADAVAHATIALRMRGIGWEAEGRSLVRAVF